MTAERADRGLTEPAVLALVIGAMTAVMYASHLAGHWWGDDWALYIRQAEGLLDGDPGSVVDQNRFAVDSSRGAAFSPPLYPWGFPLLLAPAVAILGHDLDRLAIVPVLCAAVFACCWYALARPRIGAVPAMVGVVAVTLTPVLLGWTELIQSEWPFLAVTGVALVGIDRAARSGAFVAAAAPVFPLVLLGLGATASFSVRREGLAVTAAIAAAQVAAIVAARIVPWRLEPTARGRLGARLILPHATALAGVGVLHVLLPSTLVPRYEGTSIANVWRLSDRHIKHIADISGLKRPWDADPMVLGNVVLGWAAVVAYFSIAFVGIALALGRNRHRDLHLVAYVVVAFVIGGSFRVAINRYVVSVAPIMSLLGLVAIATLMQYARRPRLAVVVVTMAALSIAAGNIANANVRIDAASRFADDGRTEWGPTHPAAVEMFEAVRSLTTDDDIIAAPKARATTLETDRLAVQVDDYRPIPEAVDLALVVTDRDAALADRLYAQPDRFEPVWQNARFILFRPL